MVDIEPSQTGSSLDLRIVTSCYGPTFWSAVPAWAKQIRAFNRCPIDIISLDDGAYDAPGNGIGTIRADPGEELRYGLGDRIRLEFISAQLRNGTTCVQADVDVLLKRSVDTLLDLPYDFIVSRASAFPEEVVARLGFVGCTGFYIARPGSLRFCEDLLSAISSNEYGSDLDQFVLNMLLVDAADKGLWTQATQIVDGLEFAMDEFECSQCRIGVLPRETIFRNANLARSVFGNHHPAILQGFLADADDVAGA